MVLALYIARLDGQRNNKALPPGRVFHAELLLPETIDDSPYVQEHRAKTLCRMLVLVAEAGLVGRPGYSRKTPPEPRDFPCRPRAPQRVRVGVTPGVGLVWADVRG